MTEEPILDDPVLIDTLNQHIAKIKQTEALFDTHGYHAHTFYNLWPLYIYVYRMAIAIITLFTEKGLSESKYNFYKGKLETIEFGFKEQTPIIDTRQETMETLMHRLRSAMQMDIIVQQQAKKEKKESDREWIRKMEQVREEEKRLNDATINRMSLLMRGGGNAKSTKSKPTPSPRLKRNTTRKPNPNKLAVAAAIKDITLLKARTDFAALKAVPCADINQAAKTGNAVMDHYFFKHRLATKTKRAISYYEWIKTNWKRNQSEHSFYKFNLAQGKTPEKARYAVFRLYYGAIHGFKPLIAKWLYCTHKPTAILDFSAGWGGRCLGAMALGIPYIGIDTNTDLRPVYERMVRELDPSLRDKVSMRFEDAATTDYSKFKYDMVFTSPPYFKTVKPTEDYAHMPRYADRADFNARFLFPVIRSTYAHMARGGTYALNIPDDMHDEIRAAGILPSRLHAKHRLFIQPRFAKGNPNHPDVQYKEHIYVWKKP